MGRVSGIKIRRNAKLLCILMEKSGYLDHVVHHQVTVEVGLKWL
jgi:hypothetical protein